MYWTESAKLIYTVISELCKGTASRGTTQPHVLVEAAGLGEALEATAALEPPLPGVDDQVLVEGGLAGVLLVAERADQVLLQSGKVDQSISKKIRLKLHEQKVQVKSKSKNSVMKAFIILFSYQSFGTQTSYACTDCSTG